MYPFDEALVELIDYDMYFKVLENDTDGQLYFGNCVAASRLYEKNDTFHTRYNLSKRPYLGPTSTDHELAFLMAN